GQKAVLRPALANTPVQDELPLKAGVHGHDDRRFREAALHGERGNRMMRMDKIVIFVYSELCPPFVILKGTHIFIDYRMAGIQAPIERIERNPGISLAANPLRQRK